MKTKDIGRGFGIPVITKVIPASQAVLIPENQGIEGESDAFSTSSHGSMLREWEGTDALAVEDA